MADQQIIPQDLNEGVNFIHILVIAVEQCYSEATSRSRGERCRQRVFQSPAERSRRLSISLSVKRRHPINGVNYDGTQFGIDNPNQGSAGAEQLLDFLFEFRSAWLLGEMISTAKIGHRPTVQLQSSVCPANSVSEEMYAMSKPAHWCPCLPFSTFQYKTGTSPTRQPGPIHTFFTKMISN